jgi:hypothetical protein
MSMKSLKQWIPVAVLAFAPLASAQSLTKTDSTQRASVTTAFASVPEKSVEEQEIEALRQELESVRAELRARQERDDKREMLLGDPDSHPLWP